MKSVSVEVEPVDDRCGYWAKYIGAHLTLKLPSEVQSEHDLPGRALQEGEEELGPGDFLIEGEENHHQFDHGWRYRLSYMGLDGTLQQVLPNTTMKQAMKTAGMSLSLLRGSGQLAACVRLIEGLRQHLVCGVMPMYSSEGPVSAEE